MHVRAHRLRDHDFGDQWTAEIEDRWEYADFLADAHWRKDWISFDCLCYDEVTDTVYCGITSFDADIFWGWSRRDERWVDCGYGRVRDRYDAKFRIIGEFQIRPDFYLPELDVYIEYWGMDTPQYKMSMYKKQALYQQEGKRLVSVYPKDLSALNGLLVSKLHLYGFRL